MKSAGAGRAVPLAVALIAGLAITAGVWFRIGELSRKPWWGDEIATWVVLSGCGSDDVAVRWDGSTRTAADLMGCQSVRINGGTGEVLSALLDDGPQNLPLYFLTSRAAVLTLGWERAPRLVSAVASVLALIFGAALARELFGTWRAGAITAALTAASPLHLRYGLEARPYALWSLFMTASAWLLLRASRTGRARDWMLFAGTQTFALQTHLLALPASIGLVGWSWLRNRTGDASRGAGMRRHLQSLAVAAALLLPWILAGVLRTERVQDTLDWTTRDGPRLDIPRRWLGILTSLFVRTGADGGLIGAGEAGWTPLARSAVGLAVAVLIGLALRQVWRDNASSARFCLLLGAPLLLAIAMPDLILGGRRSMVARYWVPVWWTVDLLVAGALASWIGARGRSSAVAGTLVFGLVVTGGLWSDLRMIRSAVWWDTNNGIWPALVGEAQRAGDGPPRAYWIEHLSPHEVLAFARLLPPATPLVLGAVPPEGIRAACSALGRSFDETGRGIDVFRCPVGAAP